jgi:hypothetical protein
LEFLRIKRLWCWAGFRVLRKKSFCDGTGEHFPSQIIFYNCTSRAIDSSQVSSLGWTIVEVHFKTGDLAPRGQDVHFGEST